MENEKISKIKRIFNNNYEIYVLIRAQIELLKEYDCEFKDDFIEGYEEMLNLLGITSDTFNDEWDDETGRKS